MSNLAFDKINIELMGNSAIIRSPSKCGRADAAKTVKITTLVRAFQDQDRGMETPILPKNTLKYVERGNKAIIYVYSEPTHFKATVGDQIYENCSRPGLVMIIELNMEGNAWSVRDSKIFAIKDDRLLINNETKLYGLPFPNISDDGWICWGSNASGGTFHSLTGLGMLIDRLFGSPFNNHVFHANTFRHLGINSHHDFFKYIQDKNVFPEELLLRPINDYRLGDM